MKSPSLLVQEVIVLTLAVGVLIGATLNANVLQFLINVETTIDHTA